jgi:hypothetical protein
MRILKQCKKEEVLINNPTVVNLMYVKVLGVREGKDKVRVNVEGRYKIRKDVGVRGGLNGYKSEGYNEIGVNVGGWFKF